MFESDFDNIAKLLIPTALRQSKTIAWLKVMISQVKALKVQFIAYRLKSLFLLSHTSQVMSLEHLLNYYFNPSANKSDQNYAGNGIYITDAITGAETYLYNSSEQAAETYLYNSSEQAADTYLYNSVEFAERIGFIVNIPTAFNINVNELSGFVEKLRLAGKRYEIKTYTI